MAVFPFLISPQNSIVSKEVFLRVRAEMARRASKRKVMQRHGKTEQGKYSAKYALTELLVCGECGSPYKRCTWARNGKKRIVWRCVSRLEFGWTRVLLSAFNFSFIEWNEDD